MDQPRGWTIRGVVSEFDPDPTHSAQDSSGLYTTGAWIIS
jgi:hypothetical protein